MSNVLQVDERMARLIEAIYETDESEQRRQTLLHALTPQPGERVLDIGTGPGFVANAIADVVGPTGSVLGVDISEPMLNLARKRCATKPWVELQSGNANQLPAPDNAFDIAISVQVYEYLADVLPALREMHRVLRPGGRGAIISTDWNSLTWNAGDQPQMQRILSAFAEHCAHQDLPRHLRPHLHAAGLHLTYQQIIPQFNPTYDEKRYSYHLANGIRAFVPGRQGITQEEATAWVADLQQVGAAGNYFFSLSQYLFVVTKTAAERL
jgi:ubiquinone/menaquinone biosynthesis C-methylase UbiE